MYIIDMNIIYFHYYCFFLVSFFLNMSITIILVLLLLFLL